MIEQFEIKNKTHKSKGGKISIQSCTNEEGLTISASVSVEGNDSKGTKSKKPRVKRGC